MNVISIIVAGLLLIAVFSFFAYKKVKMKELDTALSTKNYDHVIELCNIPFMHTLLSARTCNLYLLRASYYTLDTEAFLALLKQTIDKVEEESDRKELLELYFHIYLYKEDQEAAQKILELIDTIDNANFKTVSHFSYDVQFHNEVNLEEMEQLVEVLRFFDLGVCTFYIAKKYDQLQNYEYAIAFYDASLGCLTEHHIYAKYATKRINELKPLVDDDED